MLQVVSIWLASFLGASAIFLSAAHAVDSNADQDQQTRQAIAATQQISSSIDETLKKLEPYRNAAAWSQGFLQLIRAYPFVDFVLLEGRLRKLNSSAYLIAAPISTAANDVYARALYFPQGDLKYYLWISVNGKAEADKTMKDFGIKSYKENVQNLRQTGFLQVK